MKERYQWKAVLCTAFLLVFAGHAFNVNAQVSVSPVRVDLSEDHSKDVVRIGNQEESTASYQVEIVAWTQSDERREIYTPTEEILAVPPLFTLGPGEEQVVRVGMLTDADVSMERSYRMFITELASPEEEEQTTAVNMRLRLGIPVFVAPTTLPVSTLDYVGSKQMESQLFLQLRNNGNTHVRISEVRYLAPGAEEPEVESAAIYVLPGRAAYVPVELAGTDRAGKVTLVTDTLGTVEYDLSAAN